MYSVNDLILVAYAEQQLPEKATDASGPGKGFIDLFDTAGHLLTRLASHGTLNSPWGMAMAPAGYGQIPGRLLVGNAGDGRIGVYQMSLGAFHNCTPNSRDSSARRKARQWPSRAQSHRFPPGAGAFDPRNLYFTAGPMQGKDEVSVCLASRRNRTAASKRSLAIIPPNQVRLSGGSLVRAPQRIGPSYERGQGDRAARFRHEVRLVAKGSRCT